MVEIRIRMSDIDYSAALESVLPVLLEHLAKSKSSTFLPTLLQKADGKTSVVAKAALGVLPQDTKDDLAAACLNHYKQEISNVLIDMAQKKNISLAIQEVEVKSGR